MRAIRFLKQSFPPIAVALVVSGLGCQTTEVGSRDTKTTRSDSADRQLTESLRQVNAHQTRGGLSHEAQKSSAKAASSNAETQSSVGEQKNRPKEGSFSETKAKAEAGDAAAQNRLGLAYLRGQDVRTNLVESVKWFRKAAEQGYANAQANLGVAYSMGSGVAQDYTEAAKWFLLAADQNFMGGQLV